MRESQLIRSEALPGRRKGFCLILGAVVAFALALAPAALGATASVASNTLTYQAAADETNNVTITCDLQPSGGCDPAGNYAITDSVPITANPGCTADPVDPKRVTCPASGITGVVLNAGNMDDVINTRNRTIEEVSCGDGSNDTAIADDEDTNPLADCEPFDTPPETMIDSGPSGTTSDNTPDFTFSGTDEVPPTSFECRIIDSDPSTADDIINPCSSPPPIGPLADGSYTFEVRASDTYGADPSPAARPFTVDTSLLEPPIDPGLLDFVEGDGSSVTSAGPSRLIASFVLIAGRTLKASRKRVVWIKLNCSGNRDCAGVVKLTTANRVRVKRKRRRVTLGSAKFFIPAPRTMKVKIRLSKRSFRLVKRLKRVKVMVTVTDRDRAGRARIGTRATVLRVR